MPRDPITNRVIRSIDMTGQRFGRWTVVRRAELPPNTKTRKARWVVVCDCGNESIATREALLSGDTQSCGCLAGYVRSYQSEQAQRAREQERKANRKRQQHGMTETSEYNIWCLIKARCTNPRNHAYSRYGGRGITMCERWLHSFENFYADMGPRPSPRHSIDRIDNDLGYSPENCRWATSRDQGYNTRKTTFVTHNGKTLNLADWSKETGIPVRLLRSRCDQGMPPDKILHQGHLPKNPKG